jgi:hypothetical protein
MNWIAKGIASIGEGFASIMGVESEHIHFQNDAEAIQHDWEMVMGDFAKVMGAENQELKTQ